MVGGGRGTRGAEGALHDFVMSETPEPEALILEGEAGIGKTTLWWSAVDRAGTAGRRVLSTRASAAESAIAYGVLADLLSSVDEQVWSALPARQRVGVERILRGSEADGPSTEQRAVAAGFLSVVEILASRGAVVLAIDDLQWIDASSAKVVDFVTRRLTGPVKLLATVRTEPGSDAGRPLLQMPRPEALVRMRVGAMSMTALHGMIRERLGRSLSRPTMSRIHEVSGGNPLYALELARSIGDDGADSEAFLPSTLAELVSIRVGRLDADVGDVLLAAACVPAPSVGLVADATGFEPEHVTRTLDAAQEKGIVSTDGHRVVFSHPLLSRGVYTLATPARRRAMHRRLAQVIDQPELRARHLALAATSADASTLASLDAAARSARARGAPAAAAEFTDLAIKLGGDTPRRRIQLAGHHFGAGDLKRAKSLLEEVIRTMPPGALRAEASSLLGSICVYDDSFLAAAQALEGALREAGDDLALRTQVLVTLSYAHYHAGRFVRAAMSLGAAIEHAERLGRPALLSQALGLRVILGFLRGDGLDAVRMRRAQDLEVGDVDTPMVFRPRMQHAMLLAWTGELDRSHHEIASIRQQCIEGGEENELIFVAVHGVLVEIWRGNFANAVLIAEDTTERAQQLGGDVPLFVATTIQAALAAYAGRVEDARRDTAIALAASQRSGANLLVVWTLTTLGFLESSLGNHEATLAAVAPLIDRLNHASSATEIVAAAFIPDAVEAMVGLGRLDEAERLVDVLEDNGRRLDRPWMLAVGARSRALVLAARGDIDGALAASQRAIDEHPRLAMPFEHARSYLLLGQIQRRDRRKEAASASVTKALAIFEDLGTTLWINRARAEMTRTHFGPRPRTVLTPSEERVAEIAATGKTNRDVASALFISPKTVEANLGRVYRKLGINSRAELGRYFGTRDAHDQIRRESPDSLPSP